MLRVYLITDAGHNLEIWVRRGNHSLVSLSRRSHRLARKRLDKFVIEIHAIIKVFHADSLVLAVCAIIVHVTEYARNTICWNAGDAKVFAITGAVIHHRNDGQSAIQSGAKTFQRVDNYWIDSRGGRGHKFTHHADRNTI